MKIVVISDTHGGHEELGSLSGDILIHCGDLEHLFAPDLLALREIDRWFARQDFAHIFYVGGNHDHGLEAALTKTPQPLANAHFLQDAQVTVGGLVIYGSSWVPELRTHAFYAVPASVRHFTRRRAAPLHPGQQSPLALPPPRPAHTTART